MVMLQISGLFYEALFATLLRNHKTYRDSIIVSVTFCYDRAYISYKLLSKYYKIIINWRLVSNSFLLFLNVKAFVGYHCLNKDLSLLKF